MLKQSEEKNIKDKSLKLEKINYNLNNVGKATIYIYVVLLLIAIGLVIALFVLFR